MLVSQNAVPEQQLATQQAPVSQDEGNRENDEGVMAAAKTNVDYSHITSPDHGPAWVCGWWIPATSCTPADTNGMLVITQMDPISVIFTLPEDQLPAVVQKFAAGNA